MLDLGRRVLAVLAAMLSAVTFVVQFYNDEIPYVALFSAWVLAALLAWEIIDSHIKPKPDVRFRGYSPVHNHPVRYTDGENVKSELTEFRRIVFCNEAADPSGEQSTAHHLTGRVTVRDRNGEIVDEWDGRWSDFAEVYNASDKWKADQIDLPANGKDVTFDVVTKFLERRKVIGWDNSLSSGMGPRPELNEAQYEVEVCLRADNMKSRRWHFRLRNDDEQFELMLIADRSGPTAIRQSARRIEGSGTEPVSAASR